MKILGDRAAIACPSVTENSSSKRITERKESQPKRSLVLVGCYRLKSTKTKKLRTEKGISSSIAVMAEAVGEIPNQIVDHCTKN